MSDNVVSFPKRCKSAPVYRDTMFQCPDCGEWGAGPNTIEHFPKEEVKQG